MIEQATQLAAKHGASVLAPAFNSIANALDTVEREKSVVCVIHPEWTSQAWWVKLNAATKEYVPIGFITHAIEPNPDHPKKWPGWRLRASVVAFH